MKGSHGTRHGAMRLHARWAGRDDDSRGRDDGGGRVGHIGGGGLDHRGEAGCLGVVVDGVHDVGHGGRVELGGHVVLHLRTVRGALDRVQYLDVTAILRAAAALIRRAHRALYLLHEHALRVHVKDLGELLLDGEEDVLGL